MADTKPSDLPGAATTKESTDTVAVPGQVAKIEPPATALEYHSRVLGVIEALVALDPPADSPEGRLLHGLAIATENFEREYFSIEPSTPEEAAAFRAEQAPCDHRYGSHGDTCVKCGAGAY